MAAARQVAAANTAAHPWADPHHDVAGDIREAKAGIERSATDVFGGILPAACALGHENQAGSRFCRTCGLPMDAQLPAPAQPDLPRPPGELTAEERRRREEQHLAAIAANLAAEQSVVDIAAQEDPSTAKLRIHFVSEGFTFGGKVWHIGEELEIGPGHPRWEQVLPWITLTKPQQVGRWGRVFFDQGPWPYQQMPPGTEMLLPELGGNQLALMRRNQKIPAVGAGDMPNSLIPR